MVAAERLTIRITAIDSLNNCWRLGQTTSLSSLTVSARKPLDAAESAGASELLAEVSSEVGLVTEGGPGVDRNAGRHSAKQTPYWMHLNSPAVRIAGSSHPHRNRPPEHHGRHGNAPPAVRLPVDFQAGDATHGAEVERHIPVRNPTEPGHRRRCHRRAAGDPAPQEGWRDPPAAAAQSAPVRPPAADGSESLRRCD